MTKQDLLLQALKMGRTVTHGTAMLDLKIPNLTAVIGDLRRAGHKIVVVKGYDVEGKPFNKWVMPTATA